MTNGIDAVIELVGLGIVSTGQIMVSSIDPAIPLPGKIRPDDRFFTSDRSVYISGGLGNYQAQNRVADVLASSGTTALMITTLDHGYVTGVWVEIRDALQAEYNGVFQITVLGDKTFTYQFAGSATSPATHAGGGILIFADVMIVTVTSELTGESQNKPFDTSVTVETVRTDMASVGGFITAAIGGINPEDDPNPRFFDIQYGPDGDILTADAFETALLMSIFEEVRATPKEVMASQLRRGWLGNESTPNFEQGSKAWTFEQERITGSILAELGQVIRNGFQWFIDEDLLLNVIVEQPILVAGRVGVFVKLFRDGSPVDRRFFELWENTGT